MVSGRESSAVDAYIAKAGAFAQPILTEFRRTVHKACPEVEEAIKWSRPFFLYRGAILCNMAAFKAHCSIGFWGQEIAALIREAGAAEESSGMATLEKITKRDDLPSQKVLAHWVKTAAAMIDRGEYTSPVAGRANAPKEKRAEIAPPPEFAAALKRDKTAGAQFAAFSPSSRREYIEWIAEAKRPETRDKRIATALEWIAEGKKRNWTYL